MGRPSTNPGVDSYRVMWTLLFSYSSFPISPPRAKLRSKGKAACIYYSVLTVLHHPVLPCPLPQSPALPFLGPLRGAPARCGLIPRLGLLRFGVVLASVTPQLPLSPGVEPDGTTERVMLYEGKHVLGIELRMLVKGRASNA